MRERLHLKVLARDPCENDFTWYEMIRDELLRKTVGRAQRVLDVGCARGEPLLMLSGQIGSGMGVDISEEGISAAESARKKLGIRNLEFTHASAVDLPFESGEFDAALMLGDVLCYDNLYGRQEQVLSEIRRVLKDDGLTVYQGMNWDWEYKLSPSWTYFMRADNGNFRFHRNRRTASGCETSRDYDVVPGTPLHDWLLQRDWPVSPQGHDISIDVIEERKIPQRWLKYSGVSRYQHYTPASLRRRYQNAGFRHVEVLAYGQTYDIVNKAGLLESVGLAKSELAEAEAAVALELRTGSGPWLFLVARK